ncbi:uncharacterized protein MKZ38_008312 [Zalerion maritima]|uniref:Uncharacterized protein n=1 Tax=Zalerion maritima TaxID=339359 RepID=A0AAD5RHS8_9PEZI|nr:uncharacterized protein MKZ38_008312 [Zalerion maritima]
MRPSTSSPQIRTPLAAASAPFRGAARRQRQLQRHHARTAPATWNSAGSRRAYSQSGGGGGGGGPGNSGGSGSRPLQLLAVGGISAYVAWNYDNVLSSIGLNSDYALDSSSASTLEKKKKKKKSSSSSSDGPIQKVDTTLDEREHDASSIDFYRNQVVSNLANPGLYVWGSNKGLVAAPDSPRETFVKRPRRIPFFDGVVLRDVKMGDDFGVAVMENGDLVQWGRAFGGDGGKKSARGPESAGGGGGGGGGASYGPEVTIKGKDITKVEVSMDRIIALSSSGTVYSVPVARHDQLHGPKLVEPSSSMWIPYWKKSSPSERSLRVLKPRNLGWGESVVDVRSGLEHCLLLTSSGRVFSAASSSTYFPERGQLGIADLRWDSRPEGAYDQMHEVTIPDDGKGRRWGGIKQIATGDFHSVMLDDKGTVYSFGDNTFGQLGREIDRDREPLYDSAIRIYQIPPVAAVHAGGSNTFFTVTERPLSKEAVSEIYAAGLGIAGSLGAGGRQHVTQTPVKVKKLSNLSEWDEKKKALAAIKPSRISVGNGHSAVIMQALAGTQDAWPVYMWGINENYELGTGRRVNGEEPARVPPLEGEVSKGGATDAGMGEVFLAVAPKKKATVGEGKNATKKTVEQRIECGRGTSAAYVGV